MTDVAHPPLRTYGRVRSRVIKPTLSARLESLLPKLSLPPLAPGALRPENLKPGATAVVLEIGFGGGEHLAKQAAKRPDALFLGAEPFLNGVASALRHVDEAGLENVRLHCGDAREVVLGLTSTSVDEVYILFPDPWPKTRHHKRRLIQPEFVEALARIVKPAGFVRFATDWADYADAALATFLAAPVFHWQAERADDWRLPPASHETTRYQDKGLGDISPVFFDFARRSPD